MVKETNKTDEIKPLEELHPSPLQSLHSVGAPKVPLALQHVWLLLPALATHPLLTWVSVAVPVNYLNKLFRSKWF